MENQNSPVAGRGIFIGLFFVALSSLLYELLLTRIFSVTLYYHFAFVAVSVAMFGLTVGAMLVMIMADLFKRVRITSVLAVSSILMSILMVIYICMQVFVPPQTNIYTLFLTQYIIAALPFIFSGICLSLIISRYTSQVEKLYAVDLIGSAIGCLAAIYVFVFLDGPTAVVFAAVLAALSAFFFIQEQSGQLVRRILLFLSLLLFVFVCFNAYQISQQNSFLRLRWTKNVEEPELLYEKWNHFSRIRVNEIPELSEDFRSDYLRLDIDSSAATFLNRFDGDLDRISYLTADIQNLVHTIRPDADVCVIGAGAGRDILSALVFHQSSVRAIEMNQDIIYIVNQVFGDFTGHLDQYPNVTFVNDEARSYLSRTSDRFDIIQVSLIDTWAATAAGAFALTENGLYTTEAWELFLDRLTNDGVLTFTRWYFEDSPGEMYRMVSLAHDVLTARGIDEPRQHLLIAKEPSSEETMGTLLVSPRPFTDDDINTFTSSVEARGFQVVLTPQLSTDPLMADLTSYGSAATSVAALSIDVRPSTDDWPFFFNMLHVRDAFSRLFNEQGMNTFNMDAVSILVDLAILITLLALAGIVVPLFMTLREHSWRGSGMLTLFFIAIGFGFMFVEIALLQRLSIYLGHPTYSLVVVLFSLLLSTGIGSYLAKRLAHRPKHWSVYRFYLLVLVLAAVALVLPWLVEALNWISMTWRILLSLILVMSLGLFMGMAFPLGIKIAATKKPSIIPWFWGVNGATSVCASVFAVVLAMQAGTMFVFWVGAFCYFVAFISFGLLIRSQDSSL